MRGYARDAASTGQQRFGVASPARPEPSGATPSVDTAATASPVPGPARGRLIEPQDAVAAAAGAVLGLLVFLVVRRSLIDDAFITLSYARNLAEHFHWGLTQFRTANTATSPLNVLVLGLGTFLTRDAVRGLGLVFVILNAL